MATKSVHKGSAPAPHNAFADRFAALAKTLYPASDPSHDYLHILRVVALAKKLAAAEGADLDIVVPAAWLHDCVNVPKDDPQRAQASTLSADAAIDHLKEMGYSEGLFDAIHHAICAHSFSAGIPPETIEAKVVQDADRLDALGAIGIARLFTVGAKMGRAYYDPADFFAENRPLDDGQFTLDHCAIKLFPVAENLQTETARAIGAERAAFLATFLETLHGEVA